MPIRSSKQHDANDWVTMSFRVRHKDAVMIHSAAEQSSEGFSTATHMRKLVLQWAAEEMGVETPDYSASELNQEDISSVARQLGMSPREYMAYAARQLAASMLQGGAGAARDATPKRAPSGMHLRFDAKRR